MTAPPQRTRKGPLDISGECRRNRSGAVPRVLFAEDPGHLATLDSDPDPAAWARLRELLGADRVHPEPDRAPPPVTHAAVGARRRRIAAAADAVARTGRHPHRTFVDDLSVLQIDLRRAEQPQLIHV